MGMKKFFKIKSQSLLFGKMFGNGSGIGFGYFPNFKQYSILAVFENLNALNLFLEKDKYYKWMCKISAHQKILKLLANRSVGVWDGKTISPEISEFKSEKIVVLTRAKLRLKKVKAFWKKVPQTNKSLANVGGRVFSAGMGEWPLSHPITFSIWENEQKMLHFAYEEAAHKDAIKSAREGNWFKEDLFVRYSILEEYGF